MTDPSIVARRLHPGTSATSAPTTRTTHAHARRHRSRGRDRAAIQARALASGCPDRHRRRHARADPAGARKAPVDVDRNRPIGQASDRRRQVAPRGASPFDFPHVADTTSAHWPGPSSRLNLQACRSPGSRLSRREVAPLHPEPKPGRARVTIAARRRSASFDEVIAHAHDGFWVARPSGEPGSDRRAGAIP